MAQQPPYPPAADGQQPGYYPMAYPPPGGDAQAPPGGFVQMPQPGAAAPAAYPPPQQQQPPPVTMQPQSMQMQQTNAAAAPLVPNNCPPGLEYMTQIDQLIVKQKVELMEAFTGCETKNKYKIKNSMGQEIYKAKEDTDCCTRQCCGPARPFEMTVKDNSDREVMHLSRPLACQSALCPCCLQSIDVQAPPGTTIGSVEQDWTFCVPQFSVLDHTGTTVLKIEGPFCTFSFCGDVEFKVLSADGSTEVGKISKQWSGFAREAFTDSDNFGISFPMDLDVRMKATLLGALFLIDFMFFEKQNNESNDGVGMLS